MNENVDALIARLTHVQLEALAEDCEDYLVHRYIPLHSHSYTNIIRQPSKKDMTTADSTVASPLDFNE